MSEPASIGPEGRLPAGVRGALAATGCAYEVLDCDPELADTAAFCARYGYPLADSANAILVKSKSGERRWVACVLLADSRLDVNHTVRKHLAARRVSFASAAETRERTGMELGGVTPFGLPGDLELWIDARVMGRERIILGAGTRAAKLRLAPAALLGLPRASVVEGLALPAGGG